MATYLARESFTMPSRDGLPRLFRAGDPIEDNDVDFKGREHLFQSADEAANQASLRRGRQHPNRATETATAAPGEVRTRTRPPEPTTKQDHK